MRRFDSTVVASAGGFTYGKVYVVDTYANPANIAVAVNIDYGNGQAIYSVQHTLSDPTITNLNVATNGVWLDNDILASASTSNDTNYFVPPTAIRLKLYATASAQATMKVIQAGPP